MRPRLLLVDDERAIRFAVCDYFGARGYDVDAVADRATALARLAEHPYDLVIVDLRLTGTTCTDGLRLIRDIRGRAGGPPVVLLTGSASPDVLTAAESSGAAAVLFKTGGLAGVSEVVCSLLEAPAA